MENSINKKKVLVLNKKPAPVYPPLSKREEKFKLQIKKLEKVVEKLSIALEVAQVKLAQYREIENEKS